MKSPESYRKEYPKSAKEKFVIPRNKDGEPNQEVFEIAKDFVEKLSKHPSFIGAAPYGSKMRGYSQENSDIDIAIFEDGDPGDLSEKGIDVRKLEDEAIDVTNAHGGPDVVHTQFFYISKDTIKHAIVNHNFYPGRIALINFLGVATGPKVEQYRKIFAELVNVLPEDKREKFKKIWFLWHLVSKMAAKLLSKNAFLKLKKFLWKQCASRCGKRE